MSLGINYGLVSTSGVPARHGPRRRSRRHRGAHHRRLPVHGRQPAAAHAHRGGGGWYRATSRARCWGRSSSGLLDTFGKAYIPKMALFFAWIVFLARPARHGRAGSSVGRCSDGRTPEELPGDEDHRDLLRPSAPKVPRPLAIGAADVVVSIIVLLLPLFIPSSFPAW